MQSKDVRTSVSRALGKGSAQLAESPTITVIWKQGLVRRRPRDDRGWWESRGPRCQRLHPPKALLQRF